MDQAKAAVKDFLSKDKKHDTTVHEKVAPAMTHETVTRTQHENVQTALDKERHQDHYHTSVQPIKDEARLPEQQHHNILPVEHRSFEHDNTDNVKQKLAAEQAKFRDEQTRVKGEHTSSINPVVAGEHVHHHVHETIQPVIERQTIEPHVVHTTVPVHEVHHEKAQHHATSALPAVSMSEFKKQGGVLSGRDERHDGFEGEPRNIGGTFGHNSKDTTTSGASGALSSGAKTATAGRDSAFNERTEARGNLTNAAATGTTGTSGVGNTHEKASMLDKLNPKKDADRDGKAGIMD